MADKLHGYENESIRVTWDARRCIHAAECVRGLPRVFEPGRRPWIVLEGADADAVMRVVSRCPSGALHAERRDGGMGEAVPAANQVRVSYAGPLMASGALEVARADGTVLHDTRITLCRCGGSRNRPFCDNSHLALGFRDRGDVFEGGVQHDAAAPASGALRIVPQPDGPLRLSGPVTVTSADGRVRLSGERVALCRCGQSRNKPFCDGSHTAAGFTAA